MRSKFVMQIRATYTSTHLCSQAECACLRKPVRVIEWSCMQYEGAMRRNRLRATRNAQRARTTAGLAARPPRRRRMPPCLPFMRTFSTDHHRTAPP